MRYIPGSVTIASSTSQLFHHLLLQRRDNISVIVKWLNQNFGLPLCWTLTHNMVGNKIDTERLTTMPGGKCILHFDSNNLESSCKNLHTNWMNYLDTIDSVSNELIMFLNENCIMWCSTSGGRYGRCYWPLSRQFQVIPSVGEITGHTLQT